MVPKDPFRILAVRRILFPWPSLPLHPEGMNDSRTWAMPGKGKGTYTALCHRPSCLAGHLTTILLPGSGWAPSLHPSTS